MRKELYAVEKRWLEGLAKMGGDVGDPTRRDGADLLVDMPVPGCLSLAQPRRVLGDGDERFQEGSRVGFGCRGRFTGAKERR